MASAPTANGGPSLSEYDLILKLAQHLDRHMIFPLLEFSAGQLVDEESGEVKDETKAREITQSKFSLLKKTNMTDYVANLYCELEGLKEPPVEFADRRQKVFSQLEKYEQETSKITELLERDDVVNNLRSDKVANLEFLKREHEVGLLYLGMLTWRNWGADGEVTGHNRDGQCSLRLWQPTVQLRQLWRRIGDALPVPRSLYR
jgi:translation initiation factor 3 subunit E